MTLQEILKANGVAEDVINKIVSDMKQNKVFTAGEENLDVRYGKLKTDHDALNTKYTESQNLIAQLQEATKGQQDIQTKIQQYEQTIKEKDAELQKEKTDSALKIGLLSAGAKASDIDYLIYKMEHDSDWKPELTEEGQVKGLDEKLKGMKTQYPNQFETSASKKIDEKKLDKPDNELTVTQEQFNKMGYQERVKLYNEDPDTYNTLMGNK